MPIVVIATVHALLGHMLPSRQKDVNHANLLACNVQIQLYIAKDANIIFMHIEVSALQRAQLALTKVVRYVYLVNFLA